LITELDAGHAEAVYESLRAVREARVKVVVAAPEAIFSYPSSESLHCGVLQQRREPPDGGASFCETQFPEVPLLWADNIAGVFMYEPLFDELPDKWETLPVPDEVSKLVPNVEQIMKGLEWPSLFDNWPESVRETSGKRIRIAFESTGFPPIPAGSGHWPLVKLANETGGQFISVEFHPSRCPFRVSYDVNRMRGLQPSYGKAGDPDAESEVTRDLKSVWEELVSYGVVLQRPLFGIEGGLQGDASSGMPQKLRKEFGSIGECRAESVTNLGMARSLGVIAGRVEALRTKWRRANRGDASRVSGALDVLRCLVLNARFHLVMRAEFLSGVGLKDIQLAKGESRAGELRPRVGSARLQCGRRLCRFWSGPEEARREAEARIASVPVERRAEFWSAFDASAETIVRWHGTPYGACIESGALWTYAFLVIPPGSPDGTGNLENSGSQSSGAVPGAPSSGSTSTGTGK
jgi:hypothetical protein